MPSLARDAAAWPARCASSALAPHDRVGVIALNSDRYLELYLGLPAAGYVLVPVNSRLAPAEMRAILDDAGVSVLFADADYPGAAGVSRC